MEDDPLVRRILTKFASFAGWEVLAASGCAEAAHSFQRGRFRLLLSDVNLAQGEDGIRLARELRTIDPSLRVVLMSGRPANEARARDAGFEFFLPKPIDFEKLRDLLRLFRLPVRAGAPERVLLVEDDGALRELLALYLHAAGWEVVCAGSGAEALEAFEAGRFRMLLTDVRLDETMDGIEVARRILRLEPGLKVALISGVPGAAERVREAGLGPFFKKPIGIDVLEGLLA